MKYLSLKIALLALFVGITHTAEAQQKQPFLTPPNVPAGKWVGAITVAKGVSVGPALALRTRILQTFIGEQAGFYRTAFDISDLGLGGPLPTADVVERQFQELRENVAAYRASYPRRSTMVVISLTGHGMSEGNQFSFSLSDTSVDGEKLARWISDIQADETILVMQSCQSGILTSSIFPKIFTAAAENIQASPQPNRRLLAVVPTSQWVNSPLMNWEIIIQNAMRDANIDADKNQLITYEEWKNQLKRASVADNLFSPAFVMETIAKMFPRRHLDDFGGIDPQFFEYNFPGDIPLFVTAEGVADYLRNRLPVDKPSSGKPASYSRDTIKVYREKSMAFIDRLLARNPFRENAEFIKWAEGIKALSGEDFDKKCVAAIGALAQE